jgi:hypothetical protein
VSVPALPARHVENARPHRQSEQVNEPGDFGARAFVRE